MNEDMKKELKYFLTEKTVTDVDRSTFLVCNIKDKPNKLDVSLVFMRDWDSIESDSYTYVVIQDKGIVINLPCYWISIPLNISLEYISYVVDDIYQKDIYGGNNNNHRAPCGIPI